MLRRFGLAAVIAFIGLTGTHAQAQYWQYFGFPVPNHGTGNITQTMEFDGYLDNMWHTGWDIASNAPWGATPPVVAAAYGRIFRIVPNVEPDEHGEGNSVIIKHLVPDGYGGRRIVFTQYSHLHAFVPGIYVNMPVRYGTQIGWMGSSANASSTGTSRHLHFEVKYEGTAGYGQTA